MRGHRAEGVHALGAGDAGNQLHGEEQGPASGDLGGRLRGRKRLGKADQHLP